MRASAFAAVAWLLLGYCALFPVARAEAPNDDVAVLVGEGLKLRSEQRDAEALERFEAAYAKRKEPRTLAQIALAEQALGRWADAHTHLSAALSDRGDPWITQRRAQLESSLQRIEGELGSLEVVSNLPGAAVWVAEREVGITPLARPLRAFPGTYTVRVQLPGYQAVAQTVTVHKGQASRVDATLLRDAARDVRPAVTNAEPASTATLAASDGKETGFSPVSVQTTSEPAPGAGASSTRPKTLLITGSAVAAATFVLAGATYVVAGSKASSLEKDCYDAPCEASERDDRRGTVRRLDNVSRAFLGLGLATLVGTGIAYLVTSQRSHETPASGIKVGAAVDRSSAVLQGTMEF